MAGSGQLTTDLTSDSTGSTYDQERADAFVFWITIHFFLRTADA
jgi:hypothetical protein